MVMERVWWCWPCSLALESFWRRRNTEIVFPQGVEQRLFCFLIHFSSVWHMKICSS
ncbi:hypothetical protein C5167_029121 [Papaver somniferum]|nr:hypothetical protein C5167_029121 [Papaver somniferum]